MVIRQGYDHDGPYDDLTVDNYWAILDGVHTFWNTAQSKSKDSEQKKRLPRTAACGRLIIGVPYNEPNTPPFELVVGRCQRKNEIRKSQNIHCECTPSHVLKRQLAIPGL